MKSRKLIISRKEEITNSHPQLVEYRKQDDRDKFNDLMEILLPEIREYADNWLHRAEENHHIEKGKYKVDDFMGELYIATYDHIEETIEDKRLYVWMLSKVNQIMEDKITDDNFDAAFFQSLNTYTDLEQSSMDEKLTVNEKGELALEDSLDATMNDSAAEKYRYAVAEVFVDHAEVDIVEKLNAQLKAEDVDNEIRRVIQNSTIKEKSIIDLYTLHKLSVVEIAQVTRLELHHVQKVIANLQWSIIQMTNEKNVEG